jgi:hypothetical protein
MLSLGGPTLKKNIYITSKKVCTFGFQFFGFNFAAFNEKIAILAPKQPIFN